ncbi:MAG: ImuA family protein [Kiloniellales bacterium]
MLRLGLEAVDGALPEGGLRLGSVHEIGGVGEADAMGAATGFCVALLRRLAREALPGAGAVLWCTARDDLYAPGLIRFGLDPDRLIVVRARRREDRLWAMEEGLGCPALSAVVCEARPPGPTEGRRLQLAAERGGVTGFLLHRPEAVPGRGGAGPASAAATRWRLSAIPGEAPEVGGIDAPRWRAELLRCRGGMRRVWVMEWDHETGGFRLAAALRHGPSGPARAPARRRSA